MKACHHCKRDNADDAVFCRNCGKEIIAAAAPSPEPPRTNAPPTDAQPHAEPPHSPPPHPVMAQDSNCDSNCDSNRSAIPQQPQPEEPLAAPSPFQPPMPSQALRLAPIPPTEHSFTPRVRLRYNPCIAFIADHEQLFAFEVRASEKTIKDVRVFVEQTDSSGKVVWKGSSKKLRSLSPNAPRELHIPYRTNHCGEISFAFYLAGSCEDTKFRYESDDRRVVVYAADYNGQAALDSIIVNVKNEMSGNQGHANDYQIRNSLEGLEQLRRDADPHTRICDLIDRVVQRKGFTEVNLYPSDWIIDPPPPPPDPETEKLTLCIDDRRLHLLRGERITIGRNPRNTFALLRFDENGHPSKDLSTPLSRFHCRIEYRNNAFHVTDGGSDPRLEDAPQKASTHGTLLDGKRLKFGDWHPLAHDAGHPIHLTFAALSRDQPPTLETTLQVLPCDPSLARLCNMRCHTKLRKKGKRTPSALLIKRLDDWPEAYLALVGCADLGTADPALEGLIVWRTEKGFAYELQGQKGTLLPGTQLMLPNQTTLHITPFEQKGCKRQ